MSTTTTTNSILQFPFIDSFTYTTRFFASDAANLTPLMDWLIFGKLAENPVVTPNPYFSTVVIPSAKNRFIQSVTIVPAMPVYGYYWCSGYYNNTPTTTI